MTQRADIYSNINVLPIYQYHQVIKSGSLKYLYKLDNYDDVEVKESDNLQDVWQNINYDFGQGTLNLKFQRLKLQCLESQLDYLINGKEVAYNKYFAQYKKELDKMFTSYTITERTLLYLAKNGYEEDTVIKLMPLLDISHETYFDLYREIKSLLDYEATLAIRMDLTDSLDYKPKKEYDLMDDVAQLEIILKKDIDIMTCSVAKFYSYKKLAKQKLSNAKDNKLRKPIR